MKFSILLWIGLLPVWVLGMGYQHYLTGTIADIVTFIGFSFLVLLTANDLFR